MVAPSGSLQSRGTVSVARSVIDGRSQACHASGSGCQSSGMPTIVEASSRPDVVGAVSLVVGRGGEVTDDDTDSASLQAPTARVAIAKRAAAHVRTPRRVARPRGCGGGA